MKTRSYSVLVVIVTFAVALLASLGAVTAQDGTDGPTITVDNPDSVAPGEEFEIVISGEDAVELELSDLPAGWTLTDVTTDPGNTLALSPSPGELPSESASGDTWLAIFGEEQANASYTLTIEAPDTEGTGEFTAGAEDVAGATALESFVIEINSDEAAIGSEHAELVQPGEEMEITVEGENMEDLRVTDLPAGWTLTDVSAQPLNGTVLNPGVDALPIESGNAVLSEHPSLVKRETA